MLSDKLTQSKGIIKFNTTSIRRLRESHHTSPSRDEERHERGDTGEKGTELVNLKIDATTPRLLRAITNVTLPEYRPEITSLCCNV